MANEGSEEESESNSSFDSSTDEYAVGKIKVDQLDQLNGKQLEGVSQDFSYNYKQKAEQIARELRENLSPHRELLRQIGQKLMRLLSMRYGTFVEIVKQW
jgi:hypothetical protein